MGGGSGVWGPGVVGGVSRDCESIDTVFPSTSMSCVKSGTMRP